MSGSANSKDSSRTPPSLKVKKGVSSNLSMTVSNAKDTRAIDLPMIHKKSITPQRIEGPKSPLRNKKRITSTNIIDESRSQLLNEESKVFGATQRINVSSLKDSLLPDARSIRFGNLKVDSGVIADDEEDPLVDRKYRLDSNSPRLNSKSPPRAD